MARARATIRGDLLTLGQRSRNPAARRAVREALSAGIGEVVEQARGPWPVRTGYSRAELGVEERGTTTVAAVGNAPYTTDIVTRGGVRPWLEYVVEPLRRFARDQLPRMIADRLLRALRSRGP